MTYVPPQEILERYARVLVEFALGGGERHQAAARSCASSRRNAPSRCSSSSTAPCGAPAATCSSAYQPDEDDRANLSRDFFELADESQLAYFPARYMRGLVDEMDHQVARGRYHRSPRAGLGATRSASCSRGEAMRQLLEWRGEKENEGRFTWTLGLYGTEAMAAEASIGRGGVLGADHQRVLPRQRGSDRALARGLRAARRNARAARRAPDRARARRRARTSTSGSASAPSAAGSGGAAATSRASRSSRAPTGARTEGWIYCNQPLYRYGNLVRGIRLRFSGGRVVEASAQENERVLTEMIATEGADRIGEFSLTDRRFSRITRFMAQTLYDENMGGEFGNTHIALGRAYHDAYEGDPSSLSPAQWEELGFNSSSVHTDVVSTSDRTVTAQLRGGEQRVIYSGGEFQLD